MKQLLHLLIVDPNRGEALVTKLSERWLLPVLIVPEHVRAGPVVLRWTGERGIAGRVAGQWLGRAAPNADAVDWLTVVRASIHESATATSDLQWTRLACLRSATGWLEYQQWAVAKALASVELPAVPGPFGQLSWTEEIDAWVGEVIGSAYVSTRGRIVTYRATAYDVVLELHTARGLLYFKGLSSDRSAEAALTSKLADAEPGSFPRTLALVARPDGTVWLMDACPGSALAKSLTCRRAAHVAAAYAQVQQRITTHIANGRLRELLTLQLGPMAAWATELLEQTCEREQRARCAASIDDACEQVSRAEVSRSWISEDFDPTNVLVHNDEVRFIDLGDSALGPAPIPMATFVRRMKRFSISDAHLYETYQQAWNPPLPMSDRWRAFEVVSMLVECYLGWRRVLTKTERGEIHDLLGPARDALAGRLADAVRAAGGEALLNCAGGSPCRSRRTSLPGS